MRTKIYIQRKDIEKILETMDKFPTESNYQLVYDNSSGIGYTIDMIIPVSIENTEGQFTVEIAGVDNW